MQYLSLSVHCAEALNLVPALDEDWCPGREVDVYRNYEWQYDKVSLYYMQLLHLNKPSPPLIYTITLQDVINHKLHFVDCIVNE